MLEDVTDGLPMEECKLAFSVQGQSCAPMFDEKLTVAAWKTKPTLAIECFHRESKNHPQRRWGQ
jgi:hypothetical protein